MTEKLTPLGGMKLKVSLRDAIAHRLGYVDPHNVRIVMALSPGEERAQVVFRLPLDHCARLQLLQGSMFTEEISGHIEIHLEWLRGEPLPDWRTAQ